MLEGDYSRGGAFALFLRLHPGAFRQLMCPHPGEFAHLFSKMLMPGGLARGGMGTARIDWCIIVFQLRSQESKLFKNVKQIKLKSVRYSEIKISISFLTFIHWPWGMLLDISKKWKLNDLWHIIGLSILKFKFWKQKIHTTPDMEWKFVFQGSIQLKLDILLYRN